MSNRERIARAAEEAQLEQAEKVAKKAKSSKEAAKGVRMKIVWEVCSSSGTTVKTFPYPDKAAAEALVQELSKSTGRFHELRAAKVPME